MSSLLSTLLISFLVASTITADTAAFKPPFNNTLEPGVATECKTCPYSLCTNKAFYNYNTEVSLICWTKGTSIAGDSTWLKTSDGCYITQYDLAAYNGTYETDLSFCGQSSAAQNITHATNTVKYDTECTICPDNTDCETVSYLRPETVITTTCWTDQAEEILHDSIWLKTTSNCYVAETGLYEKADKTRLDNCGVIGFVQLNYTGVYPKTPSNSTRHSPSEQNHHTAIPNIPTSLQKRYLTTFTVSEPSAACHTCPSPTCSNITSYPFDTKVTLQCYLDLLSYPTLNLTTADTHLWFQTTEFCWVEAGEFEEDVDDEYRFPECGLFEDEGWVPSVVDDDDVDKEVG